MDNVTHGLIGLLVAEVALVLRFGPKDLGPPGLRGAALFCSIAANNTPDFDFLYAGITEGKLGYLLHHRGHTHTLAAALPMALLAMAPVLLWARKRRPSWSRADYRWLLLLCLLGPVLHVGMDALNNYGVHPFWPVHNGWFHGDAVFIIEPTFFLAMGLLLAPECRTQTARWLLRGLALAVLALGLTLRAMTVPWALGLGALAVGLWLFSRRAGRRTRVFGAGALMLALVGSFVGSRALMHARLSDALTERLPSARTYELILTPLPANPLCWSFLAVQTEGQSYLLRRGRAALVPSLVAANACPQVREEGTTAPLVPVDVPSDATIAFRGEFRAPLSELRRLPEHCEAAAFLRFARAPYFQKNEPNGLLVGDLRYDREPGLGFAEMEFAVPPDGCPAAVPPWRRPRADLL